VILNISISFVGPLHAYLHSNEKIEWNQRKQFVIEIAQGNNLKNSNQNQSPN